MAMSQELFEKLSTNLTAEDLQLLAQAIQTNPQPTAEVPVPEGVNTTPVESGAHLTAAPVQTPPQQFQTPSMNHMYAQAPQRPVSDSMRHTDGTTRGLMEAFRACGRAVNGGSDVSHSLEW